MSTPNISSTSEYIQYNSFPIMIQNYIKNYNGLVLIREKIIDGRRTQGTLWYKSTPLGVTVEDIPRDQKVYGQTAIPSTISLSTNSKDSLSKGDYNLGFKNLSPFKSTLTDQQYSFFGKVATIFPNDKNPTFSEPPGAILFIGTGDRITTIESINNPTLKFSGVLLHQGSSETNSEGCIIYSTNRKSDGTISYSPEDVKNLYRFIHSNNINSLIIIDYTNPNPNVKIKTKGTVVDALSLQPIPYPTVKYFPQYIPPINNEETPPDLIDMYKAEPVSGEGNGKGEFSIEIPSVSEYLSINGPNSSLLITNSKLLVTISAPDYEVIEVTPLKADGTFRSNLGVVKIPNIEVARREANLKVNEINDEQLKLLQESRQKKQFIEIQTEKLLSTIKGKLTPFIINQIADLGVPDPIGLLKSTKDFQKKAERYEKREKRKMENNNNEGLANEPLSNNETV
tara:strand:- start:1079 stop:2440 length:1362 start_codon:yes stop_codon:yes gene_type:complete